MNGFQETLGKLPALLDERAFLQWRGRRFDAEILIEADHAPFHLRFREGRLEDLQQGPILMRSWDFALRADAASWLAHWQPVPRPGFHDLLAMTKFGYLRIEGDFYPLMTHLQFVKDVLALPREIAGGAP
ncbi:MAG: hypothetical protein ACFCUR_21290 [Rhodomicrobiaceae bacterium]